MKYHISSALHSLHRSAARFGLLIAVAAGPASAQVRQTVLHAFSVPTDGANPAAALVAEMGFGGEARELYSTTEGGGTSPCVFSNGCGTVFRLTRPKAADATWDETILANFLGGVNGSAPYSGLLARRERSWGDPTFYGTTSGIGDFSAGTVFKLDGGKLTQIWAFSQPAPYIVNESSGALIADREGALYGTTTTSGTVVCPNGQGDGIVFKLSPPAAGRSGWTETTLWSFSGGTDGCTPYAGLTFDAKGSLYGTTAFGGAYGSGIVFKLTPPKAGHTAWTQQTLWSFTGGTDGAAPISTLITDGTGALYGTTSGGAIKSPPCAQVNAFYLTVSGCGTVFKLTPPKDGQGLWTEQTLWQFSGGADGANPFAGVIADKQGTLFGTTFNGGASPGVCYTPGNGTVFRLTPPGKGRTAWFETTLWNFSGGPDGCSPTAALLADDRGTLYGTTPYNLTVS